MRKLLLAGVIALAPFAVLARDGGSSSSGSAAGDVSTGEHKGRFDGGKPQWSGELYRVHLGQWRRICRRSVEQFQFRQCQRER